MRPHRAFIIPLRAAGARRGAAALRRGVRRPPARGVRSAGRLQRASRRGRGRGLHVALAQRRGGRAARSRLVSAAAVARTDRRSSWPVWCCTRPSSVPSDCSERRSDGGAETGRTQTPALKRIPEATVAAPARLSTDPLGAPPRRSAHGLLRGDGHLARVNRRNAKGPLAAGLFRDPGLGLRRRFPPRPDRQGPRRREDRSVIVVGMGHLGPALANSGGPARGCQSRGCSTSTAGRRRGGPASRGAADDEIAPSGGRLPRHRGGGDPGLVRPGRDRPLVRMGSPPSSTSPRRCSRPLDVHLRQVDLWIELQVLSFFRARRVDPGGRRGGRVPLIRSVGLSPPRTWGHRGIPGPGGAPGGGTGMLAARPGGSACPSSS